MAKPAIGCLEKRVSKHNLPTSQQPQLFLCTIGIIALSPELGDGTLRGFYPNGNWLPNMIDADYPVIKYLIMKVLPDVR